VREERAREREKERVNTCNIKKCKKKKKAVVRKSKNIFRRRIYTYVCKFIIKKTAQTVM
jgi:hypothetical protein